MPLAARLFENTPPGGRTLDVSVGENIPVIPPPLGGQASAVFIYGPQWITFWESPNYDAGDDQFWAAPPPNGYHWEITDLHRLYRPHGNNHWGDRIKGVSFSGPPTGDNENRTILHPDGTVTSGKTLQMSPAGVWTVLGEGAIAVIRAKSE